MSDKIRKTLCRKRIARKIQPKQFESVDISVECEDEVEWTTIEERDAKLKKLSDLILIEFQDTYNKVCEELGVEDRKAFGKRYVLSEGNSSSQSPKENSEKESKKVDDDDDFASFADSI